MKQFFPFFSSVSWSNYWSQLRHYGIAIFIFVAGLLLTLATFRFYQHEDLNREQTEFNRIADLRLILMKDILLGTMQAMKSIKIFFYASDKMTKNSFSIYVHNFLDLYPNYLALGWIDAQTALQPSRNTSVGLNFINLNKEEASDSHFFPLTYLEKSNLHESFDIDSMDYSTFLNLLKKSQQNLSVTVSNCIAYFQQGKKQGFFLFIPVFAKEKKSDSSERKLRGTIVGFSSFEAIIKTVRSQVEQPEINMNIYNLINGTHHLLHWNAATLTQPSEDRNSWKRSLIFKFGDQIWELQATPTPEYIDLHQPPIWSHSEIPILGFFISALMSSYFLVLVNQRMLIEQEVQDRTNELANINNILQQEIHQRQRIEEDFMAKQNYLQKRHETLKYLTKLTTSELRNAIHEVILRTAVVMQVNRVSVWFYETVDQIQLLSCSGLYILSTNTFSNHLEISSVHFPHYFEALSQHAHLILPSPNNAELNQELASYLAAFQIISKLDIPIVFEGNLLGILSCEETRGYRNWVLEDHHFGQTIADIVAIIIEQSARRKAERALKESEERLRFITQNSIDGIISINNLGEIISWNYGAQQMFGYNEDEILGKSLHSILPDDRFLFESEFSNKPIELKGRHRDGPLFPVEISRTRGEFKENYFDTIIIRDITERKEYEKQLIKAMRDANTANAAKSEFLATISHELRTPLNAIIGFNQCILTEMDGPINLAQQESLKKIEKSSFHLLNLINDILDLSKIEAKKMEIEILPQNIVEVITSCIAEVQPLVQQKNLKIDFCFDNDFLLIEFDRMRIRQVLLNLLSNAIKFTQKGFIKVTLINELDQIHIHIKDTGIGLLPEEIKKIFHPFSQADSSITRKYGGSGLGLVISRNIIDLHKGTITVESQKGQGSTFTITLPKRVS